MKQNWQETHKVSIYESPRAEIVNVPTDVITASGGEISWTWGSDYEQSRDNTWVGVN